MISRREVLYGAGALAVAAATMRPALAADPIRIGFTTALTGPFNEFGEGYRRGCEIAIEKVNAAGGINGRPIEIGMMLDDQLVPDRAVQNMRRILDDKDIAAVLLPSGSGPALAVVDMVVADGRPAFNPQAQTPIVTYPDGPGKPRPNVFTAAMQTNIEAKFLADYVAKKYSKIGILTENTAYGKTGAELMSEAAGSARSDATISMESYNQKDQDVTAQLVKFKRAGVETILFVGLGADLAVVRKNMVRMDYVIPLYSSSGGITPPYVEGAGELVLGSGGSMYAKISRYPAPPETQDFLDAYKAKFGADRLWGPDPEHPYPSLSGNVATGYDIVLLLAEAFRTANSTEAQAVIKAIEGISDFKGANGNYTFSSEKHHAITAIDLGIFEYVKRGDQLALELVQS